MSASARSAWEAQAARRTRAAGGAESAEDRLLRALLVASRAALAEAAHTRRSAELLDHDYLAYWVDELGLQAAWSVLGEVSN